MASKSYTISNITANHTLAAEFDNTVSLNIGFANGLSGHAKIRYKINSGSWTTITSNTSSIQATTSDTLYLEAIDFETGYAFREWQYREVPGGYAWTDSTSTSVTVNLSNVEDPVLQITLQHSSVTTYTITATAGTGGTISPSGSVVVNTGSSKTFTVTPNTGYRIKSVKLDGTEIQPDS